MERTRSQSCMRYVFDPDDDSTSVEETDWEDLDNQPVNLQDKLKCTEKMYDIEEIMDDQNLLQKDLNKEATEGSRESDLQPDLNSVNHEQKVEDILVVETVKKPEINKAQLQSELETFFLEMEFKKAVDEKKLKPNSTGVSPNVTASDPNGNLESEKPKIEFELIVSQNDKDISQLMQDVEKLHDDKVILQEQLTFLKESLKDATKQIEIMVDEHFDLKSRLENVSEHVKHLEEEKSMLEVRNKDLMEFKERHEKYLDNLSKAVDVRVDIWKKMMLEKDDEIQELNEKVFSLMKQIPHVPEKETVDLNNTPGQSGAISELMGELKDRIKQLESTLKSKEELLNGFSDLQEAIQASRETISSLQERLKSKDESIDEYRKLLAEVRKELENSSERHVDEMKQMQKKIQEQQQALADMRTKNSVQKVSWVDVIQKRESSCHQLAGNGNSRIAASRSVSAASLKLQDVKQLVTNCKAEVWQEKCETVMEENSALRKGLHKILDSIRKLENEETTDEIIWSSSAENLLDNLNASGIIDCQYSMASFQDKFCNLKKICSQFKEEIHRIRLEEEQLKQELFKATTALKLFEEKQKLGVEKKKEQREQIIQTVDTGADQAGNEVSSEIIVHDWINQEKKRLGDIMADLSQINTELGNAGGKKDQEKRRNLAERTTRVECTPSHMEIQSTLAVAQDAFKLLMRNLFPVERKSVEDELPNKNLVQRACSQTQTDLMRHDISLKEAESKRMLKENEQLSELMGGLEERVRDLESNLKAKDDLINGFTLTPRTPEERYSAACANIQGALEVARDTIESLRERLHSKDESLVQHQKLMGELRNEMRNTSDRHAQQMMKLQIQLHRQKQDVVKLKSSLNQSDNSPLIVRNTMKDQLTRIHELEDEVSQLQHILTKGTAQLATELDP